MLFFAPGCTNMNADDNNPAKRYEVVEQRGESVETLAAAGSEEELAGRLERVLGMYRLYHKRTGSGLAGVFPTEEQARERMWRCSYDLFPVSRYWRIVRGDTEVWPGGDR